MASAPAWVDMCQPSASSAIEPNIMPPAISATIIAAGRPTTAHVRRTLPSWAAPSKTWSWRQSSSVWLCMELLLVEVGLDLAGELDGERIALAVDGLADGDADPALADAVLLDVGLLLAVELDADAARQQGLVVVRALGDGGGTVGELGG